MDSLPQDIIDEIVSHLVPPDSKPKAPYDVRGRPPHPLAPVAAVSRRLQTAVERLTFRSIKITSDELTRFDKLLTPPRRRHLASLTVTVLLPPYDDAAARRAESPEERIANDESYSRGIAALFGVLHGWEAEDSGTIACRLALFINHPESPSDNPWRFNYAPWGDASPEEDGIYEGRYLHSYIRLLGSHALPTLERVKQLAMLRPDDRYGHRNTCPRVPIDLASKMPNLESVKLSMDDDEKRFPDMRARHRREAAEAIGKLSLPALNKADLDFFVRRQRDERARPPALHDPGVPDPLSAVICEFSQSLVSLKVSGVFDESLVRPIGHLGGTPWPSLRFLDIKLLITTPAGGWYFTKRDDVPPQPQQPPPPPYAHRSRANMAHEDLHLEDFSFLEEAAHALLSPVHVFRGKADDEAVAPLVGAYADALAAMPRLASAALNFELEDEVDGEPGWFCVAYFAPCRGASRHPPRMICPDCNRGPTRQLVTLLLGWEPDEALAVKLRGIGNEFHAEPMVEKTMAEFLRFHEPEVEEGLT
ncbi:hypothetical protein CTA2_6076 [Colletotrichum tanaceti]|uniref:F-box domain-containing protein n=1 Tax=Colletotrichum tanaceti TaxID=1306861 RepID=A0A4U6X7U8_9PEZI|nr:hypothetical protein CTA2_6076 [Colletotrichum tanaceti]TKW51415.1 hypothetical protein CTA1_4554 [Colletotrichum tanaceti]